jgi:hypothetical protein
MRAKAVQQQQLPTLATTAFRVWTSLPAPLESADLRQAGALQQL